MSPDRTGVTDVPGTRDDAYAPPSMPDGPPAAREQVDAPRFPVPVAEGGPALVPPEVPLGDEEPEGRRPTHDPSRREKRRAKRRRARKVHHIVRRIDTWTVLKVSLVFYACAYVVVLVAGILLWNIADRAGAVEKLESFVEDLFAYETWRLEPDLILQSAVLGGAVLAIVCTGLTVLAALLFNLIADLVGGVRLTIVEEETARPIPAAPRRPALTDD